MTATTDVAALFRRMADRIDAIDRAEFAGALIVVPPDDGSGESKAIELLMIDPRRDPAAFYGTAASKIEIAKALFEQETLDRGRGGRGMGGMR